jgi:hypothetical protein
MGGYGPAGGAVGGYGPTGAVDYGRTDYGRTADFGARTDFGNRFSKYCTSTILFFKNWNVFVSLALYL